MRGARYVTAGSFIQIRIIPADAGSTADRGTEVDDVEDHPRGCGEHYLPTVTQSGDRGSSPRMRGARSCSAALVPPAGIIPADAGSTIRIL